MIVPKAEISQKVGKATTTSFTGGVEIMQLARSTPARGFFGVQKDDRIYAVYNGLIPPFHHQEKLNTPSAKIVYEDGSVCWDADGGGRPSICEQAHPYTPDEKDPIELPLTYSVEGYHWGLSTSIFTWMLLLINSVIIGFASQRRGKTPSQFQKFQPHPHIKGSRRTFWS